MHKRFLVELYREFLDVEAGKGQLMTEFSFSLL